MGILSRAVRTAPALAAGGLLATPEEAEAGFLSGTVRGIKGAAKFSPKATQQNLMRARAMESAGADPRSIYAETGFFRGADGQMRYEVSDEKARLKGNVGADPRNYPEVVSHPAKNVMFPKTHRHSGKTVDDSRFPNVSVGGYGEGDNYSGFYSPFGDQIHIHGQTRDKTGTLAHETQHAIQEREGFASGTSPERIRDRIDTKLAEEQVGYELPHLMAENTYQKMASINRIKRAIAEKTEANISDADWANLYDVMESPRGIVSQVGRRADTAESEMEMALYADRAREAVRNDPRVIKRAYDKADRFVKQYQPGNVKYRELDTRRKDIRNQTDDELYMNTAGEVEARNVDKRRTMTMDERYESYPPDTEDRPRPKQILVESPSSKATSASVLGGGLLGGAALTGGEDAEAGLLNVAYKNIREAAQDAKRSEALERGLKRGKRNMASKVRLSANEKTAIENSIKGKGVTKKKALQYARDWKMRHPLEQWDVPEITGLTVNDKGSLGIVTKSKRYGYNVDPKTKKQIQVGSPRFNEISNNLVNEIVDIAKRARDGDLSAQRIMSNQGWYRNVEGRLRNEYGSFADMMGDILGATSPNTPVATNFRFSQDILTRSTRGDFDELMNGFADKLDRRYALEDAAADYLKQQNASGVTIKSAKTHPKYLAMMQESKDISSELRNADNVIRQSQIDPKTGQFKQYGINSYNSMIALADRWRVLRRGGAPKAKNFSGNLTGRSEQATIDVWAARNLRRHAGLKPIPSSAEGAVTGNITDVDNFRNSLEFGFGQDVIADATAKINQQLDTNLEPRDVQALQWFAEKDHWTKQGWTSRQGEGGSFETMMDEDPVESLFLGISREQSEKFQGKDFVPTAAESKTTAQKIISAGADDPDVRAVKGLPTLGKYMDNPETAMDIDVVSREDMLPTGILENAARQAVADQQDSFFVARRIPDNVASQNLESFNVGTEIYFKDGVSPGSPLIKDIQKELNAQNVKAYTLIVDPRDANRVIGMRYLDVPQFYAAEDFARMSPENYGAHVRKTFGVYDELGRNLRSKFPSIKTSEPALFDVNVKPRRQTEDYVAQLSMEGADTDALNTEFFGYRPATDRFREYVGDDKAYDTRVRGRPGGTQGKAKGSVSPGLLSSVAPVAIAGGLLANQDARAGEGSINQGLLGAAEVVAQAGSNLLAPIMAAPHALIQATTSDLPNQQIEDNYQRILEEAAYSPRTEEGQRYSRAAQEALASALQGPLAAGSAMLEPLEPLVPLFKKIPQRARIIGRSLLDMSPL